MNTVIQFLRQRFRRVLLYCVRTKYFVYRAVARRFHRLAIETTGQIIGVRDRMRADGDGAGWDVTRKAARAPYEASWFGRLFFGELPIGPYTPVGRDVDYGDGPAGGQVIVLYPDILEPGADIVAGALRWRRQMAGLVMASVLALLFSIVMLTTFLFT